MKSSNKRENKRASEEAPGVIKALGRIEKAVSLKGEGMGKILLVFYPHPTWFISLYSISSPVLVTAELHEKHAHASKSIV